MTQQAHWEKREKLFKRINIVLVILYIVISCIVLYQGIQTQYGRAILYAIVALLLLPVPWLLQKMLKIIIPSDCAFFYNLFCFSAVTFGSAMDGYDLIPWWDLFLHCLSGSLAGLVALIIFNTLRKNQGAVDHQDRWLMVLFVNFFATTTAAVWEYYEFAIDQWMGFNAQLVATTGVSDTMTDMMVCTLGGVVISILMYRHYTSGRRGWLLDTIDHYYYRNNKSNKR